MRFAPIASGSSGNAIFVSSDSHAVLVDAGVSGRRLKEGLSEIGHKPEDLDAILITHEHSDHIKGLGVLARRYGLPVYATEKTIEAISKMATLGKIPGELLHVLKEDEPFGIGDLTVSAFRTSHDAVQPVGYRIGSGKASCAVATDMGTYSEYTREHLRDLDVLLLESNHDLRMLQTGRYPYYLKVRIMGERGHLSNEDAGRLLGDLLHDGMRRIYLGHLSQENNYEALAYETVRTEVTMGDNPYKADDFDIVVAHREMVSEVTEF